MQVRLWGFRQNPKGQRKYREYFPHENPGISRKAAHRIIRSGQYKTHLRVAFSPRKRQLPVCSGKYIIFLRLFWLHNRYFGGDLPRKIRPACNVVMHAVLPIRRSDAADISNVYLTVPGPVLRFISFPPLRIPEDAQPLSAGGAAIIKRNI